MEQMRTPLFVTAVICICLAMTVELGLLALWPSLVQSRGDYANPGFGVPFLACIDVLLVFTMLSLTVGLFAPGAQGRAQPIATLVIALPALFAVFAALMVALAALFLMLALLLATPFGTMAYLAAFAGFPTGTAATSLAGITSLKIAYLICLVLAHQRFLENKTLMLLSGTSLLATWLTGLLHAIVPRFLASITDAIAAIITGILGLVWLLILLIMALPGIVRLMRSTAGRITPE